MMEEKIFRPSGTWTTPRRAIRWGWTARLRPSKKISPPARGTIPLMALMVVDLPAPLAPTMLIIFPSGMARETRSRAVIPPYRTVISLTSIISHFSAL